MKYEITDEYLYIYDTWFVKKDELASIGIDIKEINDANINEIEEKIRRAYNGEEV